MAVVQGAGPIGLLTAQQARHAGAGRVLVVEPVAARREAAAELGFSAVDAGSGFADAPGDMTAGHGDVFFVYR